jgi:hypothetical protein
MNLNVTCMYYMYKEPAVRTSNDFRNALLALLLFPGLGFVAGLAVRAREASETSLSVELRLPEYLGHPVIAVSELRRVLESHFPRQVMVSDFERGRVDFYLRGVDPMPGSTTVRLEVRARADESARVGAKVISEAISEHFSGRLERLKQQFYFLDRQSCYWDLSLPYSDFVVEGMTLQPKNQPLPRSFGVECLGLFCGWLVALVFLYQRGYRLHVKWVRGL